MTAPGPDPSAAAAEKARLDIARRFSRGLRSPGQVLSRLMAGDQPVGWLWLNVPVIDGDPLMAWVNDVEVDPAYRGRGYQVMTQQMRKPL
jgi:hypothetical protein